MLYEEKLNLILKAIVEARKAAINGQSVKLYLNNDNGLNHIGKEEVRDILHKLEIEEKIISINDIHNRLLPLNRQPKDLIYLLIDIRNRFDDWYEKYLIQQKSKPENLNWINLLKILDVCSDINEKLQISRSTVVLIPSFPYPPIGRFRELFPIDTVGTRKNYQQYRWESAQFLQLEGIALEVNPRIGDLSDYGDIHIKVIASKFDSFYRSILAEFEKRKESYSEEGKPVTIAKVDQPASEEVIWPDDFRWEGKDFVFGEYGSINFTSKDRQFIFKTLSDKKGGWATINELKGNKVAGYVRSTIKQIEDRLPVKVKEHITIDSTQDDKSQEKHSIGAYRIKVLL